MKEKCFCCGANTECKPMIVSPFRNKMCMSCIMAIKGLGMYKSFKYLNKRFYECSKEEYDEVISFTRNLIGALKGMS